MKVNKQPVKGFAACLLAGSLLLSACGSSDDSSSPAGTGEKANVAAVIKGLDNPFFQSMEKGIKDQASSSGTPVTVQAATSLSDTTGQADKLTGLAGQNFSCFIVNPISGTNLIQPLAQLAAKGKTVVNIDQPIDAGAAKSAGLDPATYIGTDNTAAGRLAGEHMVSLLPAGSKVAVLAGIAGDVTSNQRVTGFTQAVEGKLTVVQTVNADWERQQALTKGGDILRSNGDVLGFFAANDDMGLGVGRAVANAGKTGTVKVISVDGVKDALNAVKSGEITATVAQYPYIVGQMGVEACQVAASGGTLPKNVVSPVELVTNSNADAAIGATPKPFGNYEDPLKALIK